MATLKYDDDRGEATAFENTLLKMNAYVESLGNSDREIHDLSVLARDYIPELISSLMLAMEDLRNSSICGVCKKFDRGDGDCKTNYRYCNSDCGEGAETPSRHECFVWRGIDLCGIKGEEQK